jgi:hypothetical protein
MWSDLWGYFKAVFDRAGTLTFGTVASFVLCLFTRAGLPDMTTAPAWVLVIGVFLSILSACFQTWRSERKKTVEAEQRISELIKPLFRLSILRSATMWPKPDSAGLVFEAVVENLGAPSYCAGYVLTIKTKDGKVFRADHIGIPPDGLSVGKDGHQRIVYPQSEYLPNKTATEPIQRGERVFGVLFYGVRDIAPEELENSSRLEFEYGGIDGKRFISTMQNLGDEIEDAYEQRMQGMKYGDQ